MREERRQDPKPTHVNVSYINETKPTELVKSKHYCGYFIV